MEQEKKKGVVGKVIVDMKESTKAVNQINKENLAAVRADSKANFKEATTPSPEFQEFKETKGLKNKAKVVAKHIKEGAAENSEKEKQRRQEIKSHTGYKEMLEEQREKRQETINNKY